jgi:hypothetical protein
MKQKLVWFITMCCFKITFDLLACGGKFEAGGAGINAVKSDLTVTNMAYK